MNPLHIGRQEPNLPHMATASAIPHLLYVAPGGSRCLAAPVSRPLH